MKLGVISDLHIDINREFPVIETLADCLRKEKADGVIVAGDICEDAFKVREAMERLERLAECPVFYVPGNHDLWSPDLASVPTDEIYRSYEEDERCLCGRPVFLDGAREKYALVGDTGWYDYSFASREYSLEELETMERGGRIWQDRLKNQWTRDNREQMRKMVKRLEEQLQSCAPCPAVAVTHMLPVEEFCVPQDREMWSFFNGFLGGKALGEMYVKNHVKYGICGHVHYRKRVEKDGITYLCPCLGYYTEWERAWGPERGADLLWQIRDSLQWIEL